MTTENTDLDILASDEGSQVILSSGRKVTVERLRTRQTMKLLKILTRGAGGALADLDFSGSSEDAAVAVLGATIFAIPEAEDETIDFVRSMVVPADLIKDPRSGPEREVNERLFAELDSDLENPDLDDLVSILERVITVEAPHIMALGKRLAVLLTAARQNKTATEKKASAKQDVSSKSASRASTRKAS